MWVGTGGTSGEDFCPTFYPEASLRRCLPLAAFLYSRPPSLPAMSSCAPHVLG